MWAREVLLAVIGLSAGLIVAGGLFAFIASLGVVSDIADRTHTQAPKSCCMKMQPPLAESWETLFLFIGFQSQAERFFRLWSVCLQVFLWDAGHFHWRKR